MPKRHVLILRLYVTCGQEATHGIFSCEDPDTGRQQVFRDAQTLWQIVSSTLARQGNSRTSRRPASGRRKPSSRPQEPS